MTLRFHLACVLCKLSYSYVSTVAGDLSSDLLAAAVGHSYGGSDLGAHWRSTVPSVTDACTWPSVACQGDPHQPNFSFAIGLENQAVTGKQSERKHPDCTTAAVKWIILQKSAGTLSAAWWSVPSAARLTSWNLSGNQVSGTLPDWPSGSLPLLETMDLSGNLLSGLYRPLQ